MVRDGAIVVVVDGVVDEDWVVVVDAVENMAVVVAEDVVEATAVVAVDEEIKDEETEMGADVVAVTVPTELDKVVGGDAGIAGGVYVLPRHASTKP